VAETSENCDFEGESKDVDDIVGMGGEEVGEGPGMWDNVVPSISDSVSSFVLVKKASLTISNK